MVCVMHYLSFEQQQEVLQDLESWSKQVECESSISQCQPFTPCIESSLRNRSEGNIRRWSGCGGVRFLARTKTISQCA